MTPAQIIFEECGTPIGQSVEIKHVSLARATLVSLWTVAPKGVFNEDFAYILFHLDRAARRLYWYNIAQANIAWGNAMHRMRELSQDLVNEA